MLGVSDGRFGAGGGAHEEDGEAGLADHRLGKGVGPAGPRRPGGGGGAALSRALSGLHGQAFPRASGEGHGFGWGYTWLKLHLQWAGLAPKAPRKGAHRRKRERRPLPGMMLHQDDSRHAWLEGQPALDPIVTLDDATGGDLFGVSGRGGGHGLDLPGAEGGLLRARPADEPLHRSRGAFLSHPESWRRDRSGSSDPGRPGTGRAASGATTRTELSRAWSSASIMPGPRSRTGSTITTSDGRTRGWAISHRWPMPPISPQHAIVCATPTSSADRMLLHPRPTA